jgi:hypothetical protein
VGQRGALKPAAAPSALEFSPELARMEMKKVTGGSLRAVGYDASRRTLVVELTAGTFEYGGVSADTYRRMLSSSSPWSFFRDNIQEEFMERRIK